MHLRTVRTCAAAYRTYAYQPRAHRAYRVPCSHAPSQTVPAAAHPRRAATTGEGLAGAAGAAGAGKVTKRGLYKRLQVQSFAAALRALQLPTGATVLDCGSGQGNPYIYVYIPSIHIYIYMLDCGSGQGNPALV